MGRASHQRHLLPNSRKRSLDSCSLESRENSGTAHPWGHQPWGCLVLPALSFGLGEQQGRVMGAQGKRHYSKDAGAPACPPPWAGSRTGCRGSWEGSCAQHTSWQRGSASKQSRTFPGGGRLVWALVLMGNRLFVSVSGPPLPPTLAPRSLLPPPPVGPSPGDSSESWQGPVWDQIGLKSLSHYPLRQEWLVCPFYSWTN